MTFKTIMTRALTTIAPILKVANKAAEHMPKAEDGALSIAVKVLAMADVVREVIAGGEIGEWQQLRERYSLEERESQTFVSLFFGTALREAFPLRRRSLNKNNDALEADLGGGQRLIFCEERYGRPRMADEFLVSPGADLLGVIERLWDAYPSGIYISVATGPHGYGRETTVCEATTPKVTGSSPRGAERLRAAIEKQARRAAMGVHSCYLCYGPPGTGKSTFATEFARGSGGRLLEIDATSLAMISIREMGFLLDTLQPSALVLNDIDRAPVDAIGPRLLYLFQTLKAKQPDVPVILTCNDPSKLDSALLCPHRINEALEFPLPDVEERRDLFEALCPWFASSVWDQLAADTDGFSHAFIAHMAESLGYEDPVDVLANARRLLALGSPAKSADDKPPAVPS